MDTFKIYIKKYYVEILFCLPILGVLFIFRKYLGGQFPAHPDTLSQFYPYFQYVTGGKPSMVQEIFSGFPILASPMSVLSPLAYPLLVFFTPLASYKIIIFADIILTYIFTFLYARKINLDSVAAIFSATIFTFSGQLMLWADTVPNTNYYLILPAILYFWECACMRVGWQRFAFRVLAGLLLGYGWLSGHPQYILYIHSLFFFYVILVPFAKPNWIEILKRFCSVSSVFLISLAVGFWRIYLTLDFQALTGRSNGVGISDFFIQAYWPHDLVHYFLPFFYIPVASTYSSSLYVGILPLIFGLLSIFYYKKIKDTRFLFYLVTFSFCLLASFKYSPVAYLMHALPFFDALRGASRIMFVGNFAFAFVSGYMLNYILENYVHCLDFVKKCIRFGTCILGSLLGVGIFSSLFYILFFNDSKRFFTNVISGLVGTSLNADQLMNLGKNLDVQWGQFIRQFTFLEYQFIILVGICLSIYILFRVYHKSKILFSVGIIVITVANLTLVYTNYFRTVDVDLVRTPPDTVRYILETEKSSGMPYRVYSFAPDISVLETKACGKFTENDSYMLSRALAEPNYAMSFGIDTLAGYDNFQPARVTLVNAYLSQIANTSTSATDFSDRIRAMRNILRMMNVKYVITYVDIHDVDFSLVYSTTMGRCEYKMYVYELKGYWPRYFLTGNTEQIQGGDTIADLSVLTTIEKSNDTPKVYHMSSSFWPGSLDRGINIPLKPDPRGNSLLFEVDGGIKGKVLFVGNTYLPRWKAFVDATDVPVQNVNYQYMAVYIPPGVHVVRFEYQQPFGF